MVLKFDAKYIRSKDKVSKKIGLESIRLTEKLFRSNHLDNKLQLKIIRCRRDKHKQSIRVLGNNGYRILLTTKDEIVYFQDIMKHDKYDRLTKNC